MEKEFVCKKYGLSQQEFYNSHKILSLLKEITDYRIFKTEIYDGYLRKKVWVYYFKLEQNNIPISEEQYNKFKEFGIREVII